MSEEAAPQSRRARSGSKDSGKPEIAETSIEAVQAEQQKIEEEMKKRKERLEAWRAARQKEEDDAKAKMEEESKKGWSLEDDEEDEYADDGGVVDDDEEEGMGNGVGGEGVEGGEKGEGGERDEGSERGEGGSGGNNGSEVTLEKKKAPKSKRPEQEKAEEEEKVVAKEVPMEQDDVDPLDAFMVGVQQEVKRIHHEDQKKMGVVPGAKREVEIVVKVVKANKDATEESEDKGELMQNDQDAIEYSEEEEGDDELATALLNISKKNKRKELPSVDHQAVQYLPFRKSFYREVPELARMTPEEVSAYRIDLEGIKIKGKDCPKPLKTWAQCGLSGKILDVIKKSGYEKPTPIQAQAIPAIMSGRDVIGIAKTGSGKTLAFVLPMLRHVADQPPLELEEGPIALILTPTRELAIQIYNECKKFCKGLKMRPVCVYGGTGISEQIADLKRGAEIVVCTPGRMIDMLAANSGKVTNLQRITYVVLDEADRMFDMGFEPQVMKIIGNIRPDRQTVLFSATFPRQMEALARKILTKPVEVQVGGRSVVCKDVEQSVILIEEHRKFFKLLEVLGIYQDKGSILIFVEKQESADLLIRDLMKAGYSCMALHGGMDQSDRDSTISDFKNGNIKVLVATSVAARGLDVKHLILVVNYDCPNHYEDYVHRCGRTGRAGSKGNAYTFITPEQQRYSGEIVKALELSGATVPKELSDMWQQLTDKLKAEGKLKPGKKFSGFKGKGYKFDEAEATKTAEERLKQKSALGLADSDDEDEVAILNMEKKLEEVFSGKAKLKDALQPPTPTNAGVQKASLLGTPTAPAGLLAATAIADRIMMSKGMSMAGAMANATQEATSSIMKGGGINITGAALASQIAASINKRVGATPAKASETYLPLGASVPQEGGDENATPNPQAQMRYEEEIEINDFPQQIRFRITTRDVLDDIGEYSEAYITVRGNFVHAGRTSKEGEKKLHLAIEAKSERAIQLAKQEIKRVIKEEAERMASRSNRPQKSGRYSVL